MSAFAWYSGAAAANLLANNAITSTIAVDISADVLVEAQLSESFPATIAVDISEDIAVSVLLESNIAVLVTIAADVTADVVASASIFMSVPVFADIAIDLTLDVGASLLIQSGALFIAPHPDNPRIAVVPP